MKTLPLRLSPGQDLRRAIEDAVIESRCGAAFVLSGIGSLSEARIRLAGSAEPHLICGASEIMTLAGTVATNGSHLHTTLATDQGKVVGGHMGWGCIVRTTAEVLLVLLPEWSFNREPDPNTGYDELVVRQKS
jgi:predicted DNA-binding protein with PD1-like motif